LYKNITGTSATQAAINLACSNSAPCEGIDLEDVNLNYVNNEAQSVCENVEGIITNSVNPPLNCQALSWFVRGEWVLWMPSLAS